jgi:hypothetical protein
MVRGRGPRSLHPDPARSYEHTRAKRATLGCTRLQSTEKSPAPASRMTIGCELRASPAQFRCSRHPPTSTNRPGGGSGGEVVASCARAAVAPLRSKSTASANGQPARHERRLCVAETKRQSGIVQMANRSGRGNLFSSRLETDVVDSRPQRTAIVHTCEAEPHGLPLPLRQIDGHSSRLPPGCIAG